MPYLTVALTRQTARTLPRRVVKKIIATNKRAAFLLTARMRSDAEIMAMRQAEAKHDRRAAR